MQIQADNAQRLETEWHSKLYDYRSKYPEEAAEFELLLYGGMVPGWESSLPVNHLLSLFLVSVRNFFPYSYAFI